MPGCLLQVASGYMVLAGQCAERRYPRYLFPPWMQLFLIPKVWAIQNTHNLLETIFERFGWTEIYLRMM